MRVFQRIESLCRQGWSIGSRSAVDDQERRRALRYSAASPLKTRLGWWADGVDHEAGAEVVDVASHGVLLKVEQVPPGDCELWLRLEDQPSCDWIKVEIARVEPPQLVGCRFPEGCPYELFKKAQGVHAVEYRPESSEFSSRDWH